MSRKSHNHRTPPTNDTKRTGANELRRTAHTLQTSEKLNNQFPLRKHAYSNILKIFKYIENFQPKKRKKKSDKFSDIFHVSSQNIGCGFYNEYPQSIFLAK